MKFGLIPVNIGVTAPEQMFAIAQTAEEAGYESVWTFEHVIVPLNYESKYPYDVSGKMGAADAVVAMEVIAPTARGRYVTFKARRSPPSLT